MPSGGLETPDCAEKGIAQAGTQARGAIFNRYERKSTEVGGFGIGLDIVKSVCHTYNINIDIDSTLGEGSVFYLKFPKV